MLKIDEALSNDNVEQIKSVLNKRFSPTDNIALEIRLNDSEVLARNITLPASTEENLYEVIQYEMDRYTPFTADDVYFDYRLEERLANKDLIKILLIVIKKDVLKPIKGII